MPHNLYLHSALVQTRQFEQTIESKREACRYNFWDSFIALNGALLINGAILIVAAAVFFSRGQVVTEIQQAHQLLTPLLGHRLASTVFAIALLAICLLLPALAPAQGPKAGPVHYPPAESKGGWRSRLLVLVD